MERPLGGDLLDDDAIKRHLAAATTIAVVGASPKPRRDSHHVMAYLQAHGYTVRPVNPVAAGTSILGETVFGGLADLTEPIDIIDIFRRGDAVGPLVDAVIAALPVLGRPLIWMQLGVDNPPAAARAQQAGLDVVANRCIKIDHARLFNAPFLR